MKEALVNCLIKKPYLKDTSFLVLSWPIDMKNLNSFQLS